MNAEIPSFLLKNAEPPPLSAGGRVRSISHIDRGIAGFAHIVRSSFIQWELASRKGFLQSLDARAKTLFWICLLVTISLKKTVFALALIAAALALLALFSRVKLPALYGRVVPLSLFFGFLVSAPAMLSVISPGTIVVPLFELSQTYTFWIYTVPQHVGITEEGVFICSMLTFRVFDSLSLSFLVLATTPFAEIVRAFKLFRMPDTLLLVLTLTYKYIYLFALIIADMYRARKARLVLGVSAAEFRSWSAGRMVMVFRKAQQRVEDIYQTMLCRGFSGEIHLLGEPEIRPADLVGAGALAVFVLAALFV